MVLFSCADVSSPRIGQIKVKNWLTGVVRDEGMILKNLEIVFCSDEFLLGINKEFLSHDFYTDIVTFDYNEQKNVVGELYVSLDRVLDNALGLKVEFKVELLRVLVHGVLHLCGYHDKSDKEIKVMRAKEDCYLSRF
jgi:probable rRNA maturation factor